MTTGQDWVRLLLSMSSIDALPEVIEHCEWEKLTDEDWTWLLVAMPTSDHPFLRLCPWGKLNEEQVYDIIFYKPEYAEFMDWTILSKTKIDTLVDYHPQLTHYAIIFL